ncbi:hypothetical protein PROFUN_15275 [Planoprotostelium fungivorum]|uniref:Peroxisomal membrane protein PEX16 n=1 Tax=Planoprotostelium fungivorum TaxID=1890364 RepID=A0A2P6MXD8_9EUKA|nr:hypothetical protein PROFUN_15275 [Planoprotostelium fungivorum]
MGTPKTIPNKTKAVSKRTKHTNPNDTQQLGPLLDTIYRTIRPALGFLRAAAVEDNASSNAITLFLRANKVLFYILDHQKRVERGLTLKDGIVLVGNLMDLIYDIYSYLALSEGKASPSTELARRKSLFTLGRDLSLVALQILLIIVRHYHYPSLIGIKLPSWVASYAIENIASHIAESSTSPFAIMNRTVPSILSLTTLFTGRKLTGSEEPAASSVVQNLELAMRFLNYVRGGGEQKEGSLKKAKDFFVVQTIVALMAILGGNMSPTPKSKL